MTNITKLSPNHPDYQKAVELTTKEKLSINYKVLAGDIHAASAGDILKINAPKHFYSNIKVALEKRNLVFDKHYTMTYTSEDDQEVIYITVKE